MPEKKVAIINVSKAMMGVSFASLAAIGSASGSMLIAGLTAIPAAVLATEPILAKLKEKKDDFLELPVPSWWTSDSSTWNNLCTEIGDHLPHILQEMSERLQKEKGVVTTQVVRQTFIDVVTDEQLKWEFDPQQRRNVASEIATPILQKVAEVLKAVIEPLREDIALTDAHDAAENTRKIVEALERVILILENMHHQGFQTLSTNGSVATGAGSAIIQWSSAPIQDTSMSSSRSQAMNPYFNLTTVRDPNKFFGRTQVLRRLFEAIIHQQSMSIIGLGHIGKSSVLNCLRLPEIQKRFEFDLSHHIFVYVDFREYLHKTYEDFFQNVSKVIMSQARRLIDLTSQSMVRGDEFSYLLDQINEEGFFPVMMLDSFEKITLNKHFEPEFFDILRAYATIGKVSYITATIAPLYKVSHRGLAGSPFFNIFHTLKLDAFTPEEALELITVPSQKAGIRFTSEEIKWVVKMAGLHPFFIQRVCFTLFEARMMQGDDKVDLKHVKNLAYRDLLPHFIDTWERLSETQKALLINEVQKRGNQALKLPELSKSAFFRQFVRNTAQVGL